MGENKVYPHFFIDKNYIFSYMGLLYKEYVFFTEMVSTGVLKKED